MSAVNIIAQPQHGCIHVMTDGAVYESGGDQKLVGMRSKISIQPQWPGVIAMRGNLAAAELVQSELIARHRRLNDLLAALKRGEMFELVGDHRLQAAEIELNVAGWSEGAPQVYSMLNDGGAVARGIDRSHAFELLQFEGGRVISPLPVPADHDLVKAPPDESFADCVARLCRIISVQRKTVKDGGRSNVGGFAQLTTIWPDRIETRVPIVWEADRIGEPIAA